MAIAHVGSLGTTSSATSATSTPVSITANAEVGNIVYVGFGMANVSTSSGNTNDVTGCSDPSGNTWTKVGEYTQTAGVAGDGYTVAVFRTRVTTQINNTNNITVSHSSSNARTMMVDEFTTGGAITRYGSVQSTGAAGSTNPGSLSVGSLTSAAYLAIRYVGNDNAATISSVSSGYTNMTGIAGGGRGCDGEFIISTATSYTSAPTLSASADSASVMEVISDAVISSNNTNGLFFKGMF